MVNRQGGRDKMLPFKIPEGWMITKQRRGITTIKPIHSHGDITKETRGDCGSCEQKTSLKKSTIPTLHNTKVKGWKKWKLNLGKEQKTK